MKCYLLLGNWLSGRADTAPAWYMRVYVLFLIIRSSRDARVRFQAHHHCCLTWIFCVKWNMRDVELPTFTGGTHAVHPNSECTKLFSHAPLAKIPAAAESFPPRWDVSGVNFPAREILANPSRPVAILLYTDRQLPREKIAFSSPWPGWDSLSFSGWLNLCILQQASLL